MIEQKRGCIIAVSSSFSRHPGEGFSAQSTAKSGLDAFVKSLALELGYYGSLFACQWWYSNALTLQIARFVQ
ncbi:SDR family NAD(P)-dependent oxidoreductase [Funiculus sociatus GB2-M1]